MWKILSTVRGETLPSEVIKLLDLISQNLPLYFEERELDKNVGKHYAQKLPAMVWQATSVLEKTALLKKENFSFLFPWLSKRI